MDQVSESIDQTILACLREAGRPMTAVEVYAQTGLPLPLVTRTLQTRARHIDQDIVRYEKGGKIFYEYAGAAHEQSLGANLSRAAQ